MAIRRWCCSGTRTSQSGRRSARATRTTRPTCTTATWATPCAFATCTRGRRKRMCSTCMRTSGCWTRAIRTRPISTRRPSRPAPPSATASSSAARATATSRRATRSFTATSTRTLRKACGSCGACMTCSRTATTRACSGPTNRPARPTTRAGAACPMPKWRVAPRHPRSCPSRAPRWRRCPRPRLPATRSTFRARPAIGRRSRRWTWTSPPRAMTRPRAWSPLLPTWSTAGCRATSWLAAR